MMATTIHPCDGVTADIPNTHTHTHPNVHTRTKKQAHRNSNTLPYFRKELKEETKENKLVWTVEGALFKRFLFPKTRY